MLLYKECEVLPRNNYSRNRSLLNSNSLRSASISIAITTGVCKDFIASLKTQENSLGTGYPIPLCPKALCKFDKIRIIEIGENTPTEF